MAQNPKTFLIKCFNAGIAAVSGHDAVVKTLAKNSRFVPDLILSVGKAASEMCLGGLEVIGQNTRAIVVTKYGHAPDTLQARPNIRVIEAGHPLPDQNSIRAGRLLLEAVSAQPADSNLLLLVSGGASALAESLPEDTSLNQWQQRTKEWLAAGMNIAQINLQRKAISKIKDGHLLKNFAGKNVIVCAISDVQGDSIATIGSGIGDPKRTRACAEVKLVATNKMARDAIGIQATLAGYEVIQNTESLYYDVFALSAKIGAFLRNACSGIYIWGGEPTIQLPPDPGNGGRNQSLALALAKEIHGLSNISVLVAGTDGTDGPTDAAGAVIDGKTFRHTERAQTALDQANAGEYLRSVNNIFITGPTGTNVMDLVIALVK